MWDPAACDKLKRVLTTKANLSFLYWRGRLPLTLQTLTFFRSFEDWQLDFADPLVRRQGLRVIQQSSCQPRPSSASIQDREKDREDHAHQDGRTQRKVEIKVVALIVKIQRQPAQTKRQSGTEREQQPDHEKNYSGDDE
jgi:hypothetical protein